MPVPDFIRTLRAQIGTDPLWLTGVAGVVVNDAGQFLLGRRADFGTWASVAGVLEPGEHPAEAILREIKEETGVRAEIVDLVSIAPDPRVTYPNGDIAQYLTIMFVCRYVSGIAHVADDESTEVGWFSPGALPPMPALQLARLQRARAALSGEARPAWHP